MFYIGIGFLIIFTLSRVIHLKKVLDRKLELKGIHDEFLNRINN